MTSLTIKGENPPLVKTNSTPNILNCNEAREFWISWRGNNKMELGKGPTLYQNQIISFQDKKRWVATASFASKRVVDAAQWEFPEDAGMLLNSKIFDTILVIVVLRPTLMGLTA